MGQVQQLWNSIFKKEKFRVNENSLELLLFAKGKITANNSFNKIKSLNKVILQSNYIFVILKVASFGYLPNVIRQRASHNFV